MPIALAEKVRGQARSDRGASHNARRPARVVRTVRNLLGDRSATVLEQRLLEIKLRALGVVRRAFGRARPAAASRRAGKR